MKKLDKTQIARYSFAEPLGEGNEPVVITVSDKWIELMYYPAWKERMINVGRGHLISLEKCIEDFVTVNWAQKL